MLPDNQKVSDVAVWQCQTNPLHVRPEQLIDLIDNRDNTIIVMSIVYKKKAPETSQFEAKCF